MALTLGALALFVLARGHQRQLETAAVVLVLVGALAVILFLPAGLWSLFTRRRRAKGAA